MMSAVEFYEVPERIQSHFLTVTKHFVEVRLAGLIRRYLNQ